MIKTRAMADPTLDREITLQHSGCPEKCRHVTPTRTGAAIWAIRNRCRPAPLLVPNAPLPPALLPPPSPPQPSCVDGQRSVIQSTYTVPA